MSIPKKILFRGLGGAGQRHLRIIKETFKSARLMYCTGVKNVPLLNADFSLNSNNNLIDYYNLETYENIDSAYNEAPDLTVIAVPSSILSMEAIRALEAGSNVICEKPGAVNLTEAKEILRIKTKVNQKLLFSYQREFHPALIGLKKLINENYFGSIQNIRLQVSSFVPDWHPYEDYRSLYACRKALGGGVLLTEIHELFYLVGVLGLPESVNFSAKYNDDVDVEHHVLGIMEYSSFLCSIDLCFMQKKAERSIEILGNCGYASLDLNLGKLNYCKHSDEGLSSLHPIQNDQLFRSQLEKFLDNNEIEERTHLNTFFSTMILAEHIRKSFEKNVQIDISKLDYKEIYL